MVFGRSYVGYDKPVFLSALDTVVARYPSIWYFYAPHKAEGAEAKDHYHIYLVGTNQTAHPDRPLALFHEEAKKSVCPLENKVNNLGTAYGYSYHDSRLLVSMGITRKYLYSPDIVTFSDEIYRPQCAEALEDYLQNLSFAADACEKAIRNGRSVISTARVVSRNNIALYRATKEFCSDFMHELKESASMDSLITLLATNANKRKEDAENANERELD